MIHHVLLNERAKCKDKKRKGLLQNQKKYREKIKDTRYRLSVNHQGGALMSKAKYYSNYHISFDWHQLKKTSKLNISFNVAI